MDENWLARIFGPPGTGKTTRLAGSTYATVMERGADAIRIASFSETAAAEIAGRRGVKGILPAGAVGTLHSHAYRAIGRPPVALDKDVIKDWNELVGIDWAISPDGRRNAMHDRTAGGAVDEPGSSGNELLAALDLLRARQAPGQTWPAPVRQFAKAWTAWKTERGAVDFSDMVIFACAAACDGEPMPGRPSVLVVDEAQDMTPTESALALAWGRLLGPDGRLVFALDDDQALFDFRGGDPRLVLAADATDETLSQSYRVPAAVHAVAQTWIEQCSSRYPKVYRPRRRDDEHPERDPSPAHTYGWAHRVGFSLIDPALVDAVERDLAAGSTVMVIASCGYMLAPLLRELRTRGVPFHNPYRPGEPAWNPLGRSARGMSTAERVARFLVADETGLGEQARLWTGDDVRAWSGLVAFKAACLARGAERAIDALARGTVPFEHFAALFQDNENGYAALSAAYNRVDLEWFASVIVESKKKAAVYPIQVARTQGAAALTEPPRLTVGTVHSVKGAEADVVYLSPELSAAGMRQWRGPAATRDQTRRLFYVGMTRAYHRLAVLAPTTDNAVLPAELMPSGLEVRP